ncbi:UDP-N-acetylenolpyruvoylglucosamine reductase [Kordiimonas sediminis]|uniref:UDP-N-acetylenolpyruvoylglucosamine reductase n=1 Tax=Kordiimonas sediminis TaxID=1735581 RepID=A0A919E8D8_9PROT|nr:UDP-N-acetylmuramate dehydrogenase [Kordiimonas sediminis]GHF23161.1 UDP-N-acetylenolpyruvoylglucosamine reductase [Kordiimonas sediminis]
MTTVGSGTAIKIDLPEVHGRLAFDANLSRLSWFRTGGTADVLFEPADEADLIRFLRKLPSGTPITVIGVGSNLLVRDGGIRGVVIRLGRTFSDIRIRGTVVKAGAGAMDVHVARKAATAGVAGLEFMVGVPGSIGGALRMNAGAYGSDIADVLMHARAVDFFGHVHELDKDDFGFSYRKSTLPADLIFLDASFSGRMGDPEEIQARMDAIMSERAESQPIGTRTGGSTFKNPDGRKAWELIDAAGCRGLRVGDAEMSEKHCNFLINHGAASAKDIETLGEMVRDKVKATSGIELEWEIRIVGDTDEPLNQEGTAQ